MLLKSKDLITSKLRQLEEIQNLDYLSKEQRYKVETQIKILKAGDKGEKDSAYFLNFKYKNSKNYILIHDLRIKYQGSVAQIDHLLVNRFLDFYILETKSFAQGIKITDTGEFLKWDGKKYIGIESPIEQNRRHISLLKQLILKECSLPKRLGLTIKPNFLSYILVSPQSRIIRPKSSKFNTDYVLKSDQFAQAVEERINNTGSIEAFASLTKVVSGETIKELGEQILRFHHPKKVNYFKQFNIPKEAPVVANKVIKKPTTKKSKTKSKYFCASCKKDISQKVAAFCFQNKSRFQGRAYCFECQKDFAK